MFNTEKKRLKKLKLRIEKSRLFDNIFYLRTYSDIRLADTLPLDHYIKFGLKEDRKPNKDFESIWYRKYYTDVKENEIDSFSHYVLFGRSENRFQNIEQYKERNKWS